MMILGRLPLHYLMFQIWNLILLQTLVVQNKQLNVKKFFTKEEDGLIQDWSKDIVFVNPPYGREIGKWVEKSYNEAKKGAKVVMLIPSRTDTKWFHDFIYNKAEIRFLKGRIRFLQNKKELNAAPFPTMLIIFNK